MSPLLVLLSGLALTATAAAAAAGTTPAPAHAAKPSASPRIDLASAKAIAIKARPGQIVDSELEKEAGGSGLRYSFDIKSQGVVYEVGVDAANGAVLENLRESANPD